MPLLQKNNKFDQIFTGKTFIYRKITCDHRDHSCRSCVTQPDTKRRYTRGSLLPQHVPATRSRSKAPSSAPTISCEKICCATKVLLSSFAPSHQTGLICGGSKFQGQICCTRLFQEQALSCVLKFACREMTCL